MSDYIKREDAISQLEPLWDRMHEEGGLIDPDCELGINESIEVIKAIPAADVVEVVRCKDCKWWDGIECKTRDIDVVDVDDFCSYGERKDGDEHECE